MAAFTGFSRFSDAVALNPQPLPPKEFNFADFLKGPAELVSLNPQPLPPKEIGFTDVLKDAWDLVSLNPQPLPPEPPPEDPLLALHFHFDPSAAVSLNPQPLPPEPPPEHIPDLGGFGFPTEKLADLVLQPLELMEADGSDLPMLSVL
jgi:hypothetical protein